MATLKSKIEVNYPAGDPRFRGVKNCNVYGEGFSFWSIDTWIRRPTPAARSHSPSTPPDRPFLSSRQPRTQPLSPSRSLTTHPGSGVTLPLRGPSLSLHPLGSPDSSSSSISSAHTLHGLSVKPSMPSLSPPIWDSRFLFPSQNCKIQLLLLLKRMMIW